ncbi:MAG TPA: LuxR C-terminal-related transcriptional regulator [Ktedonobacteraceae bacterium]|nr:LuxR C-terminal-related transcriptional regulator [Ktedonobacteraceae bacterium]
MNLLERDHFLDQLSALLCTATSGHGRTVLISGEAGIGKSTLVEQFVSQHSNQVRRLWGACEALFTPRPLGPLYDIATQTGGNFFELMGRQTERGALFSALLEELQKSSLPTIVVFEDVHWADEATLDLVKFLGRRILHLPVLFLVTYREDELSRDHSLRSVLGDLPGKAVARLSLSPLSEQAVTWLAQQAGHSAEELFSITGGNPFFVTEVLASDTPGVPLMVQDAVLARISRLSPVARTLLELASVVPARIERWLLDAILDVPTQALEECLSSGMLFLDHMTVAFRHEIARLAVESTLSPLRQQSLHKEVLQALITHSPNPSLAARLVHHALGAHDEVQVARYAPLAAKQAGAQRAHREAAAHYATALLETSQFSLEQQAELLEGRAYECYLTSQMEEAALAQERALRLWRELDRPDRVGHALRWISHIYWFLGKADTAKQYGREAVHVLETLPPGTDLAMAYSNLARLFMIASKTEEAVQWGEQAIKLAESLGDNETLAHAFNNMGSALLDIQDERGWAYLERSLQIALAGGWEAHSSRAYTNLAACALDSRNYSLAESFLQKGLAYCIEHDLDSCGIFMRSLQAHVLFEQGHWDDAIEEAIRVLSHSRLSIVAKIPALAVLGRIRILRGDPDGMVSLDEARDLALATRELQWTVPVSVARAEAAWLLGNLDQCLAEAQVGYDLALAGRNPWRLGELSAWISRAGGLTLALEQIATPFVLQIVGDWQGAATLWEQIGCPYEQALALADGDTDAMRNALALFEQLGAQPAVALMKRRLRQQGIAGIPRGPRPSTRANQAGLTARQLEVLQLMAEGFSNAEIANQLFTSPKTVEHHVSAVLAKLGAHSRVQAIGVASQMELFPHRGRSST